MVVLAAMTFFPQYFLRSFGYSGIAATAMAVLAATTALPAALALLGRRVDRWRILRRDLAPRDVGVWSRIATLVMRRPLPVLLVVGGALLALASPVLSVSFSQPDQRILPADHPAAVSAQVLGERFAGREGNPVDVVLPSGADDSEAVTAYAQTLSQLRHVVSVTTPTEVIADGARVAATASPRRSAPATTSGCGWWRTSTRAPKRAAIWLQPYVQCRRRCLTGWSAAWPRSSPTRSPPSATAAGGPCSGSPRQPWCCCSCSPEACSSR
jgi:uncharacterized membrane protein YdfJ with MMPL/SSD domain